MAWRRHVTVGLMVGLAFMPAAESIACTMPVVKPWVPEIEIEVEYEDYDARRDRVIYKVEIESGIFPPSQPTLCQCALGLGSLGNAAPDSFAVRNAVVGVRGPEQDFDIEDFGGFEHDDDVSSTALTLPGFRSGAEPFGFSMTVSPFDLPSLQPGDQMVLGFVIEFDPDDFDQVNGNAIQFLAGSNEPGHLLSVFPGYQSALSLPALPPIPVGPCDLDGDGTCDVSDLESLVGQGPLNVSMEINDETQRFDLNGDEQLNTADVLAWLEDAAQENGLVSPYQLGDANLDGYVDGEDFNVWNNNNLIDSLAWGDGDFNSDGRINSQDFVVWNAHRFASSHGDTNAVPEPHGFWMLMLLTVGVTSRFRRHNIIQ